MSEDKYLRLEPFDRSRSSPNGKPLTPTSSAFSSWIPGPLREKVSNLSLSDTINKGTDIFKAVTKSEAVTSATTFVNETLLAASATSDPSKSYNGTFRSEGEIDLLNPHTNSLVNLMKPFDVKRKTFGDSLGVGDNHWQAYALNTSNCTYKTKSQALRFTDKAIPEKLLYSKCTCGDSMVDTEVKGEVLSYLKGEKWFYSRFDSQGRRQFLKMGHEKHRDGFGDDSSALVDQDGFETVQAEGASYGDSER
ncbi:uncharacterized protein I206_100961 [Kwoniella pini CBS 10737]|uniref:Uncharacterized protein n=1 Tax=Kwoniella pini CBS 10737 TaxID=1296096 RepID=A0A1B9ICB4_9TREE|nr:uncharacterized protein I206_00365 [Kwoniella pini CBS 10737]OCF53064.1 hypothetical protein I206_00365 [Kwoniella pini CBS 10737]